MTEALRRDQLIAEFTAAVPSGVAVECRAVGTNGIESVSTELLHERFVQHPAGDRSVAIQWLANRAEEGFNVRFLVTPENEPSSVRVWLKYWEYPDPEPPWPAEWPYLSGGAA